MERCLTIKPCTAFSHAPCHRQNVMKTAQILGMGTRSRNIPTGKTPLAAHSANSGRRSTKFVSLISPASSRRQYNVVINSLSRLSVAISWVGWAIFNSESCHPRYTHTHTHTQGKRDRERKRESFLIELYIALFSG